MKCQAALRKQNTPALSPWFPGPEEKSEGVGGCPCCYARGDACPSFSSKSASSQKKCPANRGEGLTGQMGALVGWWGVADQPVKRRVWRWRCHRPPGG